MKALIVTLVAAVCLCGCREKKGSDCVERVLMSEVKGIVDRGEFPYKYIVIDRLMEHKTGVVYELMDTRVPFSLRTNMPPFKMVRYRDKFICFMDATKPTGLSRDELERETGEKFAEKDYEDNLMGPGGCLYYLGISMDGKRKKLLPFSIRTEELYKRRPLFEYMFDGYDFVHIPRFIYVGFDLVVDSTYQEEISLKNHLQRLCNARFYCTDPQDPNLVEKPTDTRFFATICGGDTLRYVGYKPFYRHLLVGETLEQPDFFKKLPETDSWSSLYQLVRDSTFYLEEHHGQYTKTHVPFFDDLLGDHMVYRGEGQYYERIYRRYLHDFYKYGPPDVYFEE